LAVVAFVVAAVQALAGTMETWTLQRVAAAAVIHSTVLRDSELTMFDGLGKEIMPRLQPSFNLGGQLRRPPILFFSSPCTTLYLNWLQIGVAHESLVVGLYVVS
jgi:hypothetical protein